MEEFPLEVPKTLNLRPGPFATKINNTLDTDRQVVQGLLKETGGIDQNITLVVDSDAVPINLHFPFANGIIPHRLHNS